MPRDIPFEQIDHAIDPPSARFVTDGPVSGWWIVPMLVAAVVFWAGVGYALLF